MEAPVVRGLACSSADMERKSTALTLGIFVVRSFQVTLECNAAAMACGRGAVESALMDNVVYLWVHPEPKA
eukprot:1443642-Amphidinium_carterae.1